MAMMQNLNKILKDAKIERLDNGDLSGKLQDGTKVKVEYNYSNKQNIKVTLGNHGKPQDYSNSWAYTLQNNKGGQSKIWLGAIVIQLERLADNLPLLEGEYNHSIPRKYSRDYNVMEHFGGRDNLGGEIISHELNQMHYSLCEHIRKTTGYCVAFRVSSPESWRVRGIKRFERKEIEKLHNNGYLTIVYDCGDPNDERDA